MIIIDFYVVKFIFYYSLAEKVISNPVAGTKALKSEILTLKRKKVEKISQLWCEFKKCDANDQQPLAFTFHWLGCNFPNE